MPNELILTDTGRLEIPPSNHEGFAALVKRASRLPALAPSGADGRQLLAAVLAEANKPGLAECTPQSVCKTAFNCIVLGLVPGDALGMAHFVPFKRECQLVIGYKGWTELAYDSGFLSDLHCEVVLKGEDFKRWNDEKGAHFRHTPDLERDRETPAAWNDVLFAYCVWHSTGGGTGFEIVGRKSLDKLKTRGNVWQSHPIQMALKTPIIRAAKTWRRSRRTALAGALEDAIDADKPQPALAPEEPEAIEATSLDAFGIPEPGPGEAALVEPDMRRELAGLVKPTDIMDVEFKYRPVLGADKAKQLADERRAQLKGA